MKILKLGSRGPDVKLIQSLLSKIGYNPGPIDGIYGPKTQQAVIAFQRNNNLLASGIVEDSTWQAFQVLLNGYSIYYVQRGDTIYNIARKFYTTAEAIITANPQITPNLIYIGQRLVVPYGIDIVFTDIDYTYDIMERNIFGLKARYPFLEIGTIGKSVLGRNLYYLRLGRGTREVSYNAAHHSLEWITSPLLMKFAENFLKAYATGKTIRGYNIRDIWNQSSIYIVPMVNPDGVDLVLNGLSPSNPYYNNLLQWNQTGQPFSEVWNANIRGVDLNRNYPASWEEAKAQEASLGIYGPGPTRYGGPSPLSEPESYAMVNFTRQHNFRMVLAYHSQGKVIYWNYLNLAPQVSLTIANIFSRVSGYAVADVPIVAAYAGYKDWFIKEYRRPGFTIEVGLGKNPLPISQFNTIYNDNEEILLLAPLL
ncbi:M14 family metallopeptidase [Acetivibrio clariflavus]|uniref:Gamma-D-glutamyl-(L)-meso-diaminopimelate peptidase I n=1 Tax=Acetivibrio clariflavus (strain DSM 19732 / NBRC 101661 / EBR45) TaxID=720554 RepID=G8LTS1_ACECE|nr:M14 family metallopeptidase [Acetivibrio clariflavus]AEV70581.1 gamma-D-glutamyl-{L}-meso-diaminopimelate peptidase I [Acetivibrio clariflavus DSM 19732]